MVTPEIIKRYVTIYETAGLAAAKYFPGAGTSREVLGAVSIHNTYYIHYCSDYCHSHLYINKGLYSCNPFHQIEILGCKCFEEYWLH